jgi:hypothetical protein
MATIPKAIIKQTIVFIVNGSLNTNQLPIAKITAPIAKPISL